MPKKDDDEKRQDEILQDLIKAFSALPRDEKAYDFAVGDDLVEATAANREAGVKYRPFFVPEQPKVDITWTKDYDDDAHMMPEYAKEGDSGADLRAFIGLAFGKTQDDVTSGDVTARPTVRLYPGERVLIRTGICLALPPGYEAQVRPRSGLAANYGVTVLNAPGTVDNGYRGEIKVLLVNTGGRLYDINHGDRIAQLVISPICQAVFSAIELLDETDRGDGGFGSSGIT